MEILLKKLKEDPATNWFHEKSIFSLVANSYSPIGDIVITLQDVDQAKTKVYYDKDNNDQFNYDIFCGYYSVKYNGD